MAVTNYYSVNGQIIGEKIAGGSRVDYLTDALGSVIGTVNQSAQVVNTYRYKPYGAQLAKTGVGADPAFQWVGQHGYRPTVKKWSDVYVRARHHDSATGRWTTKDPRVRPGWSGSEYIYADGNAVSNVDPTGMVPCKICGSPRLRTKGLVADFDKEIQTPSYSLLAAWEANSILQGLNSQGFGQPIVWETMWDSAGLQKAASLRTSSGLNPKYVSGRYLFFIDWDIPYAACVIYFKERGWFRYDPNVPNLRPHPAVDLQVDTPWQPRIMVPDIAFAKLVRPNGECTHRLIMTDVPGDVAYTRPLNPVGLAHGFTLTVDEQAVELRKGLGGPMVPGSRVRDKIYLRGTQNAELTGNVAPLA